MTRLLHGIMLSPFIYSVFHFDGLYEVLSVIITILFIVLKKKYYLNGLKQAIVTFLIASYIAQFVYFSLIMDDDILVFLGNQLIMALLFVFIGFIKYKLWNALGDKKSD